MTPWKKYFWLQLLVGSGLLFLETFFYDGFLSKKLFLSFPVVAGLSLLITAVLVVWKRKAFSTTDTFMTAVVAGGGLILATALGYADQTLYPNAVFSSFHIHPEIFRFWAMYLWGVAVILVVPLLLRQEKRAYFALPAYVLVLLFFVRFTFEPFFPEVGMEDGLVEWATCIFFLLTTPLAAWISLKNGYKKQFLSALFFGILTLAALFLSGEEISWGERILKFSSPDVLKANNVQQETTLHNIDPIQKKMSLAYISVGSWGTFGWMVWEHLPTKFIARYRKGGESFAPTWFLGPFFFYILWYGLNRALLGPLHYKTWEETAELVFSVGLFLFVAMNRYSPLRKYLPKK